MSRDAWDRASEWHTALGSWNVSAGFDDCNLKWACRGDARTLSPVPAQTNRMCVAVLNTEQARCLPWPCCLLVVRCGYLGSDDVPNPAPFFLDPVKGPKTLHFVTGTQTLPLK